MGQDTYQGLLLAQRFYPSWGRSFWKHTVFTEKKKKWPWRKLSRAAAVSFPGTRWPALGLSLRLAPHRKPCRPPPGLGLAPLPLCPAWVTMPISAAVKQTHQRLQPTSNWRWGIEHLTQSLWTSLSPFLHNSDVCRAPPLPLKEPHWLSLKLFLPYLLFPGA